MIIRKRQNRERYYRGECLGKGGYAVGRRIRAGEGGCTNLGGISNSPLVD